MGVDVEGGCHRYMPDDGGQCLNIHAMLQGLRREGVPLRYNNDKPEKPRGIKGFEGFMPDFLSLFQPENQATHIVEP